MSKVIYGSDIELNEVNTSSIILKIFIFIGLGFEVISHGIYWLYLEHLIPDQGIIDFYLTFSVAVILLQEIKPVYLEKIKTKIKQENYYIFLILASISNLIVTIILLSIGLLVHENELAFLPHLMQDLFEGGAAIVLIFLIYKYKKILGTPWKKIIIYETILLSILLILMPLIMVLIGH
jgi:hypothetical protein